MALSDPFVAKFTLDNFQSQIEVIKSIDDIQVQLSIFYKLIQDRLAQTGIEINKDMKEMIGLILSEVKEKEISNKSEGVDFFNDLIDPSNDEFITYFQIREDNDGEQEAYEE